MQKKITKEELLKKFGNDFKCSVTYKGKKDAVKYDSPKHVQWKNVHKILVYFDKSKGYRVDGEYVTRPGASYLLTQN